MKITKKIFSAVFATALVLCMASCANSSQAATEPEETTYELTPEETVTLSKIDSLSIDAAKVVTEESEKTEQPKVEEKPALDPGLFGTWQYGFYSDVLNFSNDACYGRVNLRALGKKGTLSEGGVYSAKDGIIKVVAYDVQTGNKAPVQIKETTHTYKVLSRSCIEFDGTKYYRVQ